MQGRLSLLGVTGLKGHNPFVCNSYSHRGRWRAYCWLVWAYVERDDREAPRGGELWTI